jgi:ribonucleoside-diphosphate reductase alpha chain
MAARISEFMRDAAYLRLGRTGQGARRLPAVQRRPVPVRRQLRLAPAGRREGRIRKHGLRNSHLLSIAPTGTISLAFADNASTASSRRSPGPTPARSACRRHASRNTRSKTTPGACTSTSAATSQAADYFVTALEISARRTSDMVAAVAPYIDTSISKTVNVPADYPYEDFQDLYLQAWKAGLKGLATYRPNSVLGSVLSVTPKADEQKQPPQDVEISDANRRLSIKNLPAPVLASLRWPGRPNLPEGNPAWTYMLDTPIGKFALFVGQRRQEGRSWPFEVWVNGAEQPRGLGAVAKTLSMDMRANDHAPGCKLKLDALATTPGSDAFEMPFPPHGERKRLPRRGGRHRPGGPLALRAARRLPQAGEGPTPVLDALFSREGAEDRHRRHAVLDGGHLQPGHRRRLRARPQGNHPARRRHPPLLGVAVGQLPARPRRPGDASCCRWTCA